ncbi:replication restart helicase PriA [Helicobacter sp. 23-1045]
MNYYKIAPLRLKLPPLIYKSPTHLQKNSIVKISIKNKIVLGIVLDSASKPNFECEVAEQSEFFLTENQAILGRFVASYYCVSEGVAFGIMVLGKCGDSPLETQNLPLEAFDLHLGSHSVDLATRRAEFANTDSAKGRISHKNAESTLISSLRGARSEASATKQSIKKSNPCEAPKTFLDSANFGEFKNICLTSRSEISLLDSANPSPKHFLKFISFSQKGLHPPTPLPPTRQKAAAFSLLGGRASHSPLLAKNRRLHYCNLESDFLHHEAGEIKGADAQFLDCHENSCEFSRNDEIIADSANRAKFAESNAILQNLNAESNAKFAESPLDSADLPRLSCAQQGALDFIFSHPKTLLFGDTGSGKTEIYINAICATIAKNQSTIFLMPEIALTPQMERRLKGVFGDLVCIWHSKISKAKKEAILANLDSAKIIAGARSALFLPVKNLGLIIVDEEHDEAYKSSTSPRYNARDLAIFLAQKQNIRLILGSATPSLNSYYNFSRENALFRLRGGYFAGERKISFDDEMLSQNMLDKIKTTLESKRQIIVFVPIRGNFKVLQCVSCGGGIKCENCAINLSLHSKRNALICHHCGFAKPFFDKRTTCQSCGGDEFRALKIGTQEICKQLQNHFPHAKIAIFDRDEIKSEGKMRRILGEFSDKKIDILVGTQMISKGHDYHNAALVAIFGIDALLNSSDFRAYERAVSLLVQIAGRTGRKSDGEVVIETKNAKFFTRFMDDYEKFLKFELQNRANLYPPFRRIALLIAQNKDESKAKNILQNAKKIVESAQKNIEIIGLSKAPIERIEGRWRYFLLLRAKSAKELIGAVSLCKNLPLTIDIDPQQVV